MSPEIEVTFTGPLNLPA